MTSRRITLGIILLFIPLLLRAQSAESPDLRKYLQPAGITKLDWLLLHIEVESSLSQSRRWDDYDLVDSVVLYTAKGRLVGMTFLVNKKSYIASPDDLLKRVFADDIAKTCKIIVNTIPEVKNCANVYANFVAVGVEGVIASGYDGKVAFVPRD